MNTLLFALVIRNSMDDTNHTVIIAIHKDDSIDMQVELFKQYKLSEYAGEWISEYYPIAIRKENIFADTEDEFNEVWADLKSINLLSI